MTSLGHSSVVATGGVYKGQGRIQGKFYDPPLQGIPRSREKLSSHDSNRERI